MRTSGLTSPVQAVRRHTLRTARVSRIAEGTTLTQRAARRFLVALLTAAVVVGGCGDGDGQDPSATPATPSTSGPSGQTTPAATAPATPTAEPAPASATPPDEGTGAGGQTYLIESGDTLSSIAQRFDTTVDALVEANNIEDPDLIVVGSELTIPEQ